MLKVKMSMTSFSFTTRMAIASDAERLFPLAAQLAITFDVNRSSFDKVFAELLASDHCRVIVAEVDERLVGYALGLDHQTFFANGRVAWVEELFVDESARRKGVAAALMGSFEEWCNEREAKLVALATRRAADFYEAIGYEDSGIYFRKMLSPR